MAMNGVWGRTPYMFGGGHKAEEHMNTFSDAGTFLRNDGRWDFFWLPILAAATAAHFYPGRYQSTFLTALI